MTHPVALVLLTRLFARVSSQGLMFINPPPYNAADNVSNYKKYKKGDIVAVSWTPGEKSEKISLLLEQKDVYDLMYPEWLLENMMGFTGFEWLVDTQKNLTDSNLFSFTVYQGSTELATNSKNSQYFFIEEDSGEGGELFGLSSSSAVSPTPASDGASTAARTAASNSASEPTAGSTPKSTLYTTQSSTRTSTPTGSNLTSVETNESNIPNKQIMHDGFSLGAKIGLGVGIPVAIVLGLLAGWLLFRRRKRDSVAHELPIGATEQLESVKGGYDRSKGMHEAPGPDLHEAPRTSIYEAPSNQPPVEIGQSRQEKLVEWGDRIENDLGTSPKPKSIRYEMDAGSPIKPHNEAVDSKDQFAKNESDSTI